MHLFPNPKAVLAGLIRIAGGDKEYGAVHMMHDVVQCVYNLYTTGHVCMCVCVLV